MSVARDTALVTVAEHKTWLDLSGTTEDDILSGLVTNASVRISEWCRRKFAQADHTDYLDGTGSEFLWLNHWPVSAFSGNYGVWIDGNRAFGSGEQQDEDTVGSAATGDFIRHRNGDEEGFGGLIYLAGVWPAGRGNIKVAWQGGYSTIPTTIKQAAHELIEHWYPIRKRRVGTASSTSPPGGGSTTFRDLKIPDYVLELIGPYRRESLP